MSTPSTVLVFLHVASNLVWIGSILAVARILGSGTADAPTRGRIGVELYRRLSVPAFVTSFAAGVARLLLDPAYYFSTTKFMHP